MYTEKLYEIRNKRIKLQTSESFKEVEFFYERKIEFESCEKTRNSEVSTLKGQSLHLYQSIPTWPPDLHAITTDSRMASIPRINFRVEM